MSARPTLLILSYHFAPSPMVGAKRFSFLAREFTRLGFDVHVIAGAPRDTPHGGADHTLPLYGTVHRVPNPFALPRPGKGWWSRLVNAVFRRVLAPVGLEYFWARAAARKALDVARSLPRGVVIATSPPHAAQIAGGRVARRLGWPLILDYRDPWSAYDWPEWHRGGLTQWIAARIESRLVRASAARVLNTPSMREWFEECFDSAPGSGNHVVPNGFDAMPAREGPPADGPLRIVHAGEIYGSRSLLPLLAAAARLQARHPERAIRVTTFGALPAAERQRVHDAGLSGFVEERPRIPFAQLFAELQRAHVLLAIVSEHMTYSTPYKVYDYMASGRPILGLAPRDAALHELLADSGAGLAVDPQESQDVENALERLLFSGMRLDPVKLDRFHWHQLAQQYRQIIDQASLTTRAPEHDAAAGRPWSADTRPETHN
jgi:glycosyltransferase involved in cell wall biosynthesis